MGFPVPKEYQWNDDASTTVVYNNGEEIDGMPNPDLIGGGSGISIDDIATNTAPSGDIRLGDDVTDIGNYALAGKPITSIVAPSVESIGEFSLQNTLITDISDENFPSLGVLSKYVIWLEMDSLQHIKLSGTKISLNSGSGAFRDNTNLVTAEFPHAAEGFDTQLATGNGCFYGCKKLELVDLGKTPSIAVSTFYNCNKLTTLILRHTDVVSLSNVNAFQNTPMRGYGGLSGTVYVPSELISSYQAASNWSTLYGEGHITFAAIEGSDYEL